MTRAPARAPQRLDSTAAAALLGVRVRTLYNLASAHGPGRREPRFPTRGPDGLYDRRDLLAWRRAVPPGRGRRGPARGRACEQCGTPVPKRWRDPDTDQLLCKPCYVAADPHQPRTPETGR